MYGHMGWPGRKAPETLMSRDVPASWRVSSCSHRAQALAMPPRWYLGRDMREEDDLALGLLGLKPLALRGKMQTELSAMTCFNNLERLRLAQKRRERRTRQARVHFTNKPEDQFDELMSNEDIFNHEGHRCEYEQDYRNRPPSSDQNDHSLLTSVNIIINVCSH